MNAVPPLSLPVGLERRDRVPDAELGARVRMVLETRPGDLPWRPGFGCDLDWLLGRSLTGPNLARARGEVGRALARWLPEVQVRRLQLRVVTELGTSGGSRDVPTAETALVPFGAHAQLHATLELVGPGGPLSFDLSIPG